MPSSDSGHSPAVSVVVPCYNAAKFIGQALDSLHAQTRKDFETIVVNDGSPDTAEFEQALTRYRDSIRYIKQENTGVAGARNTAIRASSAPLIFNLDPDDWVEPNGIEAQLAFLEARPDLDGVYANPRFFGNTNWSGTCWMDHYPSEGDVTFLSVMQGRTCPSNPGSLIRRTALERIGLYDPALHSWEDYDVWLRLLKTGGKIHYNREPIVNYRKWEGGLTTSLKYRECGVRVLQKMEQLFVLTPAETEALRKREDDNQADLELGLGRRALVEGDYKSAEDYLRACLKHPCIQGRRRTKLTVVLNVLRYCPSLIRTGLIPIG